MNQLHLFVGLSVLLITLLALNVSRVRIRERVANGDGNNVTLKKAIRAHMNAVEHILPYTLLLVALDQQSPDPSAFAVMVFGFLGARVLHLASMLGSRLRLRQISAGLTYLFEVVGCLWVLGGAFGG